jgi:DNA-binding LytR/AlgR family response regulator
MSALVVEDEWPARNYLVELIHASELAEVLAAFGTAEAALAALEGGKGGDDAAPLAVDVAFVDVHLEGSPNPAAGLELVKTALARPGSPIFVLATAQREHAIEAFDLGVVDYLVKPFSKERVRQCLERVAGRRRERVERAPSRIVARRKGGLVFLRPDEVLAFEAAERLTFVHTTRGRFDVDLSLSAILASFGSELLRTHRNWLVNAAHVRELARESGEVELVVGASEDLRVPVARDRAQAVRDALLADAAGLRRG